MYNCITFALYISPARASTSTLQDCALWAVLGAVQEVRPGPAADDNQQPVYQLCNDRSGAQQPLALSLQQLPQYTTDAVAASHSGWMADGVPSLGDGVGKGPNQELPTGGLLGALGAGHCGDSRYFNGFGASCDISSSHNCGLGVLFGGGAGDRSALSLATAGPAGGLEASHHLSQQQVHLLGTFLSQQVGQQQPVLQRPATGQVSQPATELGMWHLQGSGPCSTAWGTVQQPTSLPQVNLPQPQNQLQVGNTANGTVMQQRMQTPGNWSYGTIGMQ